MLIYKLLAAFGALTTAALAAPAPLAAPTPDLPSLSYNQKQQDENDWVGFYPKFFYQGKAVLKPFSDECSPTGKERALRIPGSVQLHITQPDTYVASCTFHRNDKCRPDKEDLEISKSKDMMKMMKGIEWKSWRCTLKKK